MKDEAYTAVALTPIRKIIAARMAEAKRTIPHFRLAVDLEVDSLLALRARLRNRAPDRSISINDLMVKACASALVEVPAMNIQWAEEEIRHFRSVDVSVVVALKEGLSTPIVRGAEGKDTWQIAREIRELSEKAAAGLLRMSDITGGTFSVSNLGMFGVDRFDAIINPPQCAILAIGRSKPCVVADSDHSSRIANVMTVTLSVDHRAIDGATAAVFLATLRRCVEQPGHLHPEERRVE